MTDSSASFILPQGRSFVRLLDGQTAFLFAVRMPGLHKIQPSCLVASITASALVGVLALVTSQITFLDFGEFSEESF